MATIKVLPISSGKGEGRTIYYQKDFSAAEYFRKIVLIDDLDASEIVPTLRKASGVVAQKGGITGHGAVLLREFKIPAVVLPKAKEILKEYQMVLISDQGYLEADKINQVKNGDLSRELNTKEIKKGPWVLVKPRAKSDALSHFTDSLVDEGYLMTPRILLNLKQKAKRKFDKDGIWVKNHPLPREMANKILNEPKWFWKHIQGQRQVFPKLKKYQREIKEKFDGNYEFSQKEAYQEILNCRDWFTKARPYVFLFAYSIDILEKEFYKLTVSFLPLPEATRLFDQIGRSAYAKKIYQLGLENPRVHKGVKFPPSPLNLIGTVPDYRRKIKTTKNLEEKIKTQSKEVQKKFYRYLEIMPVVTEFNDEMCYVVRILFASIISRFLLIIARQSVTRGLLKKQEDIFKLTVEQVGKLTH
ncbi:MAG: PEP-utilizing enzyme [bacterium]|nr:PEP-utilizing enzyme [bacterium]